MLSKPCQYAVQAVLYIAIHQDEQKNIGLKEISKSQEISEHCLVKSLQQLVRRGILNSAKGPNGGFSLALPAEKITLLQVVEIIDGLSFFDKCAIGFKECQDENPCPVHNEYKLIKVRIRNLLTQKTVAELRNDIQSGDAMVSLKIG